MLLEKLRTSPQPCLLSLQKQNQQLGSPVILWGRLLLDCVMTKNNTNSDFSVNIYIEKYVKLKIQILKWMKNH